ncbi:MAG TPA: PaaI family thioesterase [Novosphingobium sp.]|nr:PaaI family thioesterase [Novosphingobium sp.]HZV09562.1 PaaI family thioesterase [Novosphingobium sp.]
MRMQAPGNLFFDYDDPAVAAAPADGRAWAAVKGGGAFPDLAGPMFCTGDALEAGEPARFGIRLMAHHCNAVAVAHGGLLASFADTALAQGLLCLGDVAFNTPTITLNVDYLSASVLGEWLESRVVVAHRTLRMAFVSAMILAGARPVLRATGLFKTTPLADGGARTDRQETDDEA